jgi:SAM-dependent methyltransferase
MDSVALAVRRAADELGELLQDRSADPHRYVPRVEFELRLLLQHVDRDNLTLWDLGGGIGLLPLAACHLGARATNVDDYQDQISAGVDERLVAFLSKAGVRAVRHDFADLVEIDEPVTAVCSMHTIEHMHGSPKAQYHEVKRALAPNGVLMIAAPNAANVRKRISAVLGKTSWSPMSGWYETPVFRGHVREPRVADLEYIANDLGLSAQIVGKNFIGSGRPGWRGELVRRISPLLERRPTLCSDLYLIGQNR